MLGVHLDLRQSGDKLCFVTNTEERVEELVNGLDEALRTKILSRSEGEKLRGRLQFTQGRKTLSQHTQSCLCDIRKLLTKNSPRKIVSQPFPASQKERGCSACFLDVESKMHMNFLLAANVGPRAQ